MSSISSERAGKPMAAVVPVWQLEERQKRRERFFGMVEEVRQQHQDVPPAVIEQEVQEAIRATRAKAPRCRDRDEDRWVQELIQEAQDEQVHHSMTVEQMLHEDTELARYGAYQAKHLGITPRDIPRIIAASRKRHRAEGGA